MKTIFNQTEAKERMLADIKWSVRGTNLSDNVDAIYIYLTEAIKNANIWTAQRMGDGPIHITKIKGGCQNTGWIGKKCICWLALGDGIWRRTLHLPGQCQYTTYTASQPKPK